MTETPTKGPFELGVEWGLDRTADDIEWMGAGTTAHEAQRWFERRAQYHANAVLNLDDPDAFLEGARTARKMLL